MTFEDIIQGRDLIPWQDLSACFRRARGHGVSPRTLSAWQAQGLPYAQDGSDPLYSWSEVWEWYQIHYHRAARQH
jgi:hypothetical protein